MEVPGYQTRRVEKSPQKIEQDENTPIIDIIRHPETIYKQGEYRGTNTIRPEYNGQPLDTSDPNFELSKKYLDVTSEGIETMQATAKDLLRMINKEKELVLIISSPSWRAHSGALIAEKELRENGIEILNNPGEFKFSEFLNATLSRIGKLEKECINLGIDIKTKEGAKILETKRREFEAHIFQQFLRHMNNVYDYLSPQILEKLKGKRLRILCFTHSEITGNFIREAGLEIDGKVQKNSQILEVVPESKLKKGKEVATDIKLYPTQKHPGKEARIMRGFKSKE